ncbi:MAG: hypothetical protein SFV55_20305 [Haliscomenobacter sp.]|uniref:hypothetical protein n=1 Tax=Haliscomenobacter sp. TaxID=2717303 RepID=UPI0029A6F015|nr:hypothetical protein [Haliscomenobacter sp.]MDX2070783.1 hypothetical protein [Haliscomenobacter sp.]
MSETVNKPFLSSDEKSHCCNGTSTSDSKSEECLETWKKELKLACNELMEVSATVTSAEGVYSNAFTWEAKLKKWFENAEATHEKASSAYAELALFIKAVETLETNTAYTSKALQALICLVKKILDEVFTLLYEGENLTESNLIHKLKEYIRCNDAIDEQKKQAALDCIAAYESKVRAVYDLQAGIMNKMLEILHCANIIAAAVGNAPLDCRDTETVTGKNLGLKWQLEDLRKRLIGGSTAEEKVQACQMDKKETTAIAPPCGAEIAKPAKPLLPIRKMEGKMDSHYYDNLGKLKEAAEAASINYKAEMQAAREKRDKVLARKTSLDAAIRAAEAAETAK